jgi:hypothetical protein
VACYGAKDPWNQGVADQLERTLERALVPYDVKEYPDAGHSFMTNHQSIFFKVLRFANIGYNEAAALDARRRIAPHPSSVLTRPAVRRRLRVQRQTRFIVHSSSAGYNPLKPKWKCRVKFLPRPTATTRGTL